MKKESKILLIVGIAILLAAGAAYEWKVKHDAAIAAAAMATKQKEETGTKEAYWDAWWLRLANGNHANQSFVSEDPQHVRVTINHIESKAAAYDVSLNLMHLKVKSSSRYRVEFRARSDYPRSVIVGFARAHEPWTNLGLYQELQLKPDWQTFHQEFVATADDDNGRIHFDLAGSPVPAEFEAVCLRHLTDGQIIVPTTSTAAK